jgi:enoyl-CoA hydratase
MPITSQLSDHIGQIVIDHPPVNALDIAAWNHLAQIVIEVGRDPTARVLILRGEGRGFCAGVDVKELARDARLIRGINRACYAAFAAVWDCPVPVIAAVHGFCLGGGVGLAGSADVVIASEDASFGLPEIDRGALGAATHLLRLFPQQQARAMMYTGRAISAPDASRFGALEAVVPRDKLVSHALDLARQIAEKSSYAVRFAKEAFNGIEAVDVKRSYRYEQGYTFELATTPDAQEARQAFVDKRAPHYSERID